MKRFLLLFIALFVRTASANPAWWAVQDAPYRVPFKLQSAPSQPEAGILIDLPEFGQSRPDLGDVILTDTGGQPLPVAKVFSRPGGRTLLLAQTLEVGVDYFVYFGGGKERNAPSWTPKLSLFMETRPAPADLQVDAWPEVESAWKKSTEGDGAGFFPIIYHGENLFGQSTRFLTHYTGYLITPEPEQLFLYTLSSDASFVLVNDKLLFDWPGIHAPWARPDSVKGKLANCTTGLTKIDYYAAKINQNHPPAMVLGWKRNGKFETVPGEAWLHPGKSRPGQIEQLHGFPLPMPKIDLLSFIGYNDQWLYEATFALERSQPIDGWKVAWEFADGAKVSGTSGTRVLLGPVPELLKVTLTRTTDSATSEELTGLLRIDFTALAKQASFKAPDDVRRYLNLIEGDAPAQLSNESMQPRLNFLLEFGTDQDVARFVDACPPRDRDKGDALWVRARLLAIRAHADTDSAKALDEMRAIDLGVRQRFPDLVNALEIDLLAFHQTDPEASGRITQIAFLNPKSELAVTAKVRIGDLYRRLGRYKEAVAQYQTIGIKADQRSLPAQDRANSIAVRDLLDSNRREEAQAKLNQWERRHPMAKFDSDFLLLRARMLMLYGGWSEALAELESFEKIQPESAFQIDAEFFRARILFEQGHKDEARKIWKGLAKSYPKHPLAPSSTQWAAKP